MDLIFRRARGDDLEVIVRLLADDILGRDREQGGSLVEEAYWQAFEAIDADPRQLLVVAEQSGEVIATLQLTFIPSLTFHGGERAQIEAVRVDSSMRGSGVGRRMILWAFEEARSRGCHLVQLTTNKRRAEALRFYESLGFEASHEGMKLKL